VCCFARRLEFQNGYMYYSRKGDHVNESARFRGGLKTEHEYFSNIFFDYEHCIGCMHMHAKGYYTKSTAYFISDHVPLSTISLVNESDKGNFFTNL
jgi:hypothetical protein